MASPPLCALLLIGALTASIDTSPELVRAMELYEGGDPVGAESAVLPLMQLAQPAEDRARLLVWTAAFAAARGETDLAADRLARALRLDPGLELPEPTRGDLIPLLEVATRAPTPGGAAPPPPEAAPAAPPEPAPPPTGSSPAETSSAASPATRAAAAAGAAPDEPARSTAKQPPEKQPPEKQPPEKQPEKPQKGGEPTAEEEPTLQLSGSLWAVAGGLLTVGLLLSAGTGVFAASAGLHWYQATYDTAIDDEQRDSFASSYPGELQLAAILGVGATLAFVSAGAGAGVAWWLDQE